MVTVKIDGIEVQVPANTTILDAAKEAGVHIPVLCHDSRLNPFGACRVCLVEAAGNPKLMAACTTPVMDKMEVLTNTDKLKKVRRTTIELLLVNHPLECPVCDKGGECTLQDLTFETGVTKVRFDAKPKDTVVDHTNPFIERDIDRCVLCGRCVRICDEVVNVEAISFLNRGVETEIGTAFEQPWNCEYCGQCISVCPVGSLNNRVYLFKNRPWNLQNTKSVCGLCSCGCTVSIDAEGNEVFRMQELPEEGVNHGYMCAKGRFGFEFMNSVKREFEAGVKAGSELNRVSVEEAVKVAADKLKAVKDQYGSDSIGVIVSPRLTNEEAFTAQKFAREVIGTKNVYSVESAATLPEATYEDVEFSDAVLTLNIDVTEANPILGLAVRHAARKNEAYLACFYPSYTALKRVAKDFVIGTPDKLYTEMGTLVEAIKGSENGYKAMADKFISAEKPVLVYNPYNEADAAIAKEIKAAVGKIKLVSCKAKNNSVGIVDMGCANGVATGLKETGKGAELVEALKSGKLKALVSLGENIAVRTGYSEVTDILGKLDLFLVTDPFMSDTAKKATVYIPVATFAEKDGSFTNLEGRVQSINKSVEKGCTTDLLVVAGLAKELGSTLSTDVKAIRKEIEAANELYNGINWDGGVVKYPYAIKGDFNKSAKVSGNGKFYLYPASLRLHSGSYTRWSPDLIKAYDDAKAEINPEDAQELGLANGDKVSVSVNGKKYVFGVEIEKKVTKGCLTLPEDYLETAAIFTTGKYHKVDVAKQG